MKINVWGKQPPVWTIVPLFFVWFILPLLLPLLLLRLLSIISITITIITTNNNAIIITVVVVVMVFYGQFIRTFLNARAFTYHSDRFYYFILLCWERIWTILLQSQTPADWTEKLHVSYLFLNILLNKGRTRLSDNFRCALRVHVNLFF